MTDANAARPIVAGGTGATTAAAARTALGAQASSAALTSIAALTTAADRMIYTTAADTYAVATLTAAGRALLADADAAAQRTTLGAQQSNANLTSLSGITLQAGDLLYATGADTLVRLPKGTAGQVLQMNGGATAPEWGSASTLRAPVSTASGGAPFDETSIPAGTRWVEILFDRVSLDSTGHFLVQVGISSGVVTTGYESASRNDNSGTGPTTNGFVMHSSVAGRDLTGKMRIDLADASNNIWIATHVCGATENNIAVTGGGRVALSGALDRIRVTATTGDYNKGTFAIRYGV